jgi:hypothetical protein
MLRRDVGTFAEEEEFTKFALRAVALIPLTFIEYAQYFYTESLLEFSVFRMTGLQGANSL